MTPTTLVPYNGIQENRNDLRDSYLVEYSGNDLPQDGVIIPSIHCGIGNLQKRMLRQFG